ncbi:hypothetical protein A7982_12193 [Minicystis rosea]|nr:hypothetical protein A7982_12193 [Minicystis rosea]
MTVGSAILGFAAAAGIALAAAPGFAAECPRAKVGASVGALDDAWQRAAHALSQATAVPGMPWSCAGGVIEITEHDGSATLTVITADGRTIAREVSAPDEVVPLGEALLAKPLPPPPIASSPPLIAPSPPPVATTSPTDDTYAKAVPPAEPRLLLGAQLGPRYAGKANVLWGGFTVSVGVPIGAWGVGVWGRYDGPAITFNRHPAAMHEVCVGAAASRSFSLRSVELRASVVPSVAVVTRTVSQGQKPFGPSPFEPMRFDETRIEGRVGLDARAVVPITNMIRIVSALDVELSPRALAEKRISHPGGWYATEYPSYTLGFGLGLEIAVR